MSEIEQKLRSDYEQQHGSEGITYRVEQLIATLASIIDDERRLEQVVKKEGASYSTRGDKGQQVVKARPESVELLKLRQIKLAYIKQLGLGVSKADIESW